MDKLTPDSPALSDAWAGVIAQGLKPPVTPPLTEQAAQSIKARVMQRIAAQQGAAQNSPPLTNNPVVSIYRDEAWIHLGKKIQVKVLHDDGTTLSWLLKLHPGGRLPEHDHADGAEECMILEGQLCINGQQFVGGDYQIAHPGSVHFEVSSDAGALVFLKSPSSRRKSLVPG
jgi:anti-sigma factor ChrR (cupin superfamily)